MYIYDNWHKNDSLRVIELIHINEIYLRQGIIFLIFVRQQNKSMHNKNNMTNNETTTIMAMSLAFSPPLVTAAVPATK